MVRSDGNGNPEGPGSGSSEGGGEGRPSGEVHCVSILPVYPTPGIGSHGSSPRPVQIDNARVDKHLNRMRWLIPLTAIAVLSLGSVIILQNASTGKNSQNYNNIVERAIDDPAGFLQQCKAERDKQ